MYKLWGFHHNYVGKDDLPFLILLEAGSIKECRAEQRYREKLGGWTMATYKASTNPEHTWLGFDLGVLRENHPPF